MQFLNGYITATTQFVVLLVLLYFILC